MTTYSGQMSPPPTRERRAAKGVKGSKGSKGSEGEQRGAKGSEAYSILGFRVPTTWNGKSLMTTYSGQMSPPPARERRAAKRVKGSKGSEGEQREQRGAKGSEVYSILGFRVPTTWNGKSLMTTYSGQMSPPPARE